jgi:Zn-finger protein
MCTKEMEAGMGENYKFFENRKCEFYPCHAFNRINCLFCFCPLYPLDCGGGFTVTNGIKDCSGCALPHLEGGYEFVVAKLKKTAKN